MDAGVEENRSTTVPKRRFNMRKGFLWKVGMTVALVAVGVAASISPWPAAMVIRGVFNRDADKATDALEKHAPPGITLLANQQYLDGDPDASLDVYFSESTAAGAALPTVIWTHGGAWVSGNKSHYSGYYQLISSEGYTVVSPDYSLGPNQKYPTALHQLNAAHAYVVANAERLHVDPMNIILAGDSAGSQLASQLATAITSPEYAREIGITPSLQPEQLRGMVLNCGIYDMEKMLGGGGIIGWGIDRSLWAYSGDRDPENSPALQQMSTLDRVTSAFPPTYISGGNDDPLTDAQSKPLAEKLSALGVEVTPFFFPADHEPKLPHEYQFNIDNADGQKALQKTLDFLQERFESP